MKRFFVFLVVYIVIALINGCGNMESDNSESQSTSVSISVDTYDLQSDQMNVIGVFEGMGLVTMEVVDQEELAKFEQAFNDMSIEAIYEERSSSTNEAIFTFYKNGELVMGYMFTDSDMNELIHKDGTTSLVVYNGKSPMELFEQSTTEKHPAFIER